MEGCYQDARRMLVEEGRPLAARQHEALSASAEAPPLLQPVEGLHPVEGFQLRRALVAGRTATTVQLPQQADDGELIVPDGARHRMRHEERGRLLAEHRDLGLHRRVRDARAVDPTQRHGPQLEAAGVPPARDRRADHLAHKRLYRRRRHERDLAVSSRSELGRLRQHKHLRVARGCGGVHAGCRAPRDARSRERRRASEASGKGDEG
eukprot:scaffold45744_cov66-Phaeocystis_antarctica.AAC.3